MEQMVIIRLGGRKEQSDLSEGRISARSESYETLARTCAPPRAIADKDYEYVCLILMWYTIHLKETMWC
jgi:hypothetical protein